MKITVAMVVAADKKNCYITNVASQFAIVVVRRHMNFFYYNFFLK